MVNWNYARISDSPTFPRSLLSIRCERSSRFWIFNRIEKKEENYGNAESASAVLRREEKRRLDFGLSLYQGDEGRYQEFSPVIT